MSRYSSYPFAFVYGTYFYLLFQVMYVVRFGGVNWHVNIIDFALYIVGTVSVLFVMYLMRKLMRMRFLMLVPFSIAIPLAYFGALGGGLLGFLGALLFGLIPFVILLPIGFLIIKRVTNQAPQMIV